MPNRFYFTLVFQLNLYNYPEKTNFQVVQNKGLTECMIYTDGFDTLDEAQKYCDFCNSEVIQKALSISKFSGWTTRTVINNIPNILDEE